MAFAVLMWGQVSGRAEAACTPVRALECDATLTDTIETSTAKDCFSFTVPNIAGGTRVHLSVIEGSPSGTNFQPTWRLVTNQGAPASSCGSFDTRPARDCGPLAGGGSPYRLEVEDHQHNATGSYRIHLQRLTNGTTCNAVSIGCDTPVTVSINPALDTDLLTFTVPSNVSAGVLFHIRATNSSGPGSGTPSWRVLSKTGAPVSGNCGLFAATKQRDCGPLLASNDPHRIEVQDRARDETATHQFYLQRLTQGAICDTTPVGCTVITRDINSLLDSDLLTFNFNVAQGAKVRINMAEVSPSGAKFDLAWRLLTKAGVPVSGICGNFIRGTQQDCGPLAASGNPYRIEVQEFQGDDTGRYQTRVCPL
jgi:hypothetical protein